MLPYAPVSLLGKKEGENEAHSSLPEREERERMRPILVSQRGNNVGKEALSSLPEEENMREKRPILASQKRRI